MSTPGSPRLLFANREGSSNVVSQPSSTHTSPAKYIREQSIAEAHAVPSPIDSFIEILRENRLAQVASVEQQRELIRHMRNWDDWLERESHDHDRQSELRGVVEQLEPDLRGNGIRPESQSPPRRFPINTTQPKMFREEDIWPTSGDIPSMRSQHNAPYIPPTNSSRVEDSYRSRNIAFHLPTNPTTDVNTTSTFPPVPPSQSTSGATTITVSHDPNNPQAYPTTTIIIQNSANQPYYQYQQHQPPQQPIWGAPPMQPPSFLPTTAGPPVIPSMDGRFQQYSQHPPPTQIIIPTSRSSSPRRRRRRRNTSESDRGRSVSPRAGRRSPVIVSYRSRGPSPVPIPPVMIRTRSPSPSRQNAVAASSESQMKQELAELRAMLLKRPESNPIDSQFTKLVIGFFAAVLGTAFIVIIAEKITGKK